MSDVRTIEIERRFDAPPSAVFRALEDPDAFAEWFWGSLTRTPRASAEFRPGGAFRVTIDGSDGSEWSAHGVYGEIQPNKLVVHTLAWDAPVGYEEAQEQVEWRIDPDGDGARVAFRHTGRFSEAAAREHERGWIDVLDTLGRHLESDAGG